MTTTQTWTEQTVQITERNVRLLEGGAGGDPVWVLHHSIGNPGWIEFYDRLAATNRVTVPDLPGFGQSERPEWAREPRDLGIALHLLFDKLGLDSVSLVGLGFGGWIAAEMATLNQSRIKRLMLVGAAGVQPREGEIVDQMLIDYDEYVKAGFHDEAAFHRQFGDEVDPAYKELWDYSREMTARLAWKPYMFNRRLLPLLREVETATLIVWGDNDRIVPIDAAHQYQEALRNSRLELVPNAGHFLDMEKPEELARLVSAHLGG
jgi:pimeloyl-ACP methyl ester carboxylesterase